MIGGECTTDVRSASKPPRTGAGKEGIVESVGIEEFTALESGFKPGASPRAHPSVESECAGQGVVKAFWESSQWRVW